MRVDSSQKAEHDDRMFAHIINPIYKEKRDFLRVFSENMLHYGY